MNLASIIEGHDGDSVALVSRGRTTTYAELRESVARVAGALDRLGVEPGDRVAVIASNNWYCAIGVLATLHVGAAVVPLNPRSPLTELESQMRQVETAAVVTGPGPTRLLLERSDGPGRPMIGANGGGHPDVMSFEDALACDPVPCAERSSDDLAALMFTSGTAGGPKAAMLTHGNLLTNLDQIRQGSTVTMGPADTVMGVLPICHIYGFNVVLAYTLRAGATVLLVENFDPINAVESINRHHVTFFGGVPPMFRALLDLPEVDPADLASLRLVSCGASALPEDVFEEFRARFGLTITEGYGLTEASPGVTISNQQDAQPGVVGHPLPGIELRLVDDDGEAALIGDPGEVLVRGPNVFAGYWADPEATASVLDAEGWLHTGDIGVVDDDGSLALVGRSKDLVIVSGFNVYPGEVEEVLATHPAVAEVAVAGVPHPHTGETVVAHVVLAEDESTDELELISHCERALPRYKAPTKIRFVDELPRTALGKVTRRLLG